MRQMEIRGGASPEQAGRVAAPDRQTARPRPYEGTWRFTAPVHEASVPRVRHAVRDLLLRRHVPVSGEVLQALMLILSELVTNSVRHAALLTAEIGVEVSVGADWVRVGVEDGHPYRPATPAFDPSQEHLGGRGLLLVGATVAEAGGACEVERTASGGKAVRAVLPLLPPAPPAAPGLSLRAG